MINNNIFPCLWFDGNAKEAAVFYCKTFGGHLSAETSSVLNIDLFGQKMMLLNAGAQFVKNASVSFTVLCRSQDEIIHFWESLNEQGKILTDLAPYGDLKLYGWIRDRFGVTWQLSFSDKIMEQRLVPNLMFSHGNKGRAKEAAPLYTNVFPNSETVNTVTYAEDPDITTDINPDYIKHCHFKIDNYSLFAFDSIYDHEFNFNEGISLVVLTDDQQETDRLWQGLIADGGRALMCGWMKDRFGMCWQIIPKRLLELMNDFTRPDKAQKVVQAMMNMQKIQISTLEEAYSS